MVAVLTFVCLVTLTAEITHVPVTVGHSFIRIDMTALVRYFIIVVFGVIYSYAFNIVMH